jgi:APA family basic amino acid/polyamine antiporter
MAEKEFFARKATGLIRNISPWTAMMIGFVVVIGMGWQKRVFQAVGWAPIPENTFVLGLAPMTMAFIITGIIALPTCYVLGYLSAAMPRSSSQYVALTRTVHPVFGMVGTWLELVFFLLVIGMVSVVTWEATAIFSGLLGVDLSVLMQPVVLFLLGALYVSFFAIIASFGVRLWGTLMSVLFWIPLLATIVMFALFAIADPTSMAAGILATTGHTAEEYTKAALNQGMATAFKGNYWDAMNVCILAAAWAWTGFGSATFVAGEVKEASKRMLNVMLFTGAAILVVYTIATQLCALAAMAAGKIGDFSFYSAFGYLSWGGGSLSQAGLPTSVKAFLPVVAAFQAAGSGWMFLVPLMACVGILWTINGIPAELLVSSRIIFAMAFDRVLPEKVAYVNEKYHSPVVATIVCAVVSSVGLAAESGLLGPLAGWVAAGDLWDYIFFAFVCVGGIIFPYRLKEIYKACPIKQEVGGVPLITIVSIFALLGNLWVILTALPGLTFEAATFTVLLMILPALIYYYYRAKARITKVDYGTIYTSLPPE